MNGDNIYVIYDGGEIKIDNKLIRYRNGILQTLSHLLIKIYLPIAVLDGNYIYLYSSNYFNQNISSEIYDISTDQWSFIDNSLPHNIYNDNSVIYYKNVYINVCTIVVHN